MMMTADELVSALGHGPVAHRHVPVADNCQLRLGMIWAGYRCKLCAEEPPDRCVCGRPWPCMIVPHIVEAHATLTGELR